MKKTRKILCLLLCVMLVCVTLAGSLTAMAENVSVEVYGTGYVDLGNVIQLTEYSDGVLHLIYYPKWMETSQVQMPILVFANGTGCAPVLYISFLLRAGAVYQFPHADGRTGICGGRELQYHVR